MRHTARHFISVVALALIAGACGGVTSEPSGRGLVAADPRAAPTSVAPTTTAPLPASATTTSPSTTSSPAPVDPSEDQLGNDCTRSLRMRNIHYQLAFFSMCPGNLNSPPVPVYRKMETPPNLQEKLELLVRGARVYELDDGLASGFDYVDERNEIDVVATVSSAGIATIDFRIGGERWHPGSRASASAQYLSFMEPLEATVFSEAAVTGLDRSTLCWGESDCTGITTRETWEGILFVNYGLLCDPAMFASQDWGCVARDAATYPAIVVGVAADDALNMRSGPGVAYFKVGAAAPNATIEVLENYWPAADGALWRLVRNESGEVGWVNASFLANTAATGERTAEEQIVDAFIEFAARPSDDTFAALPLAHQVALGLGPNIVEVVAATALRDANTWEIDLEYFRAAVGPFSAFERFTRAGDYEVTVGTHDHCASPPMPPPDGFGDLTRVSVQPAPDSIDSCLMWSSVDFFVDPDGTVAAITLDFWEP